MAKNMVDVTVRLLGDTSGFKKSMQSAQSDAATLGDKMKVVGRQMSSVGRTMTVGVTMPIVGAMALGVKAASDLGESMNKVNVVFGKSSTAVQKWSKDAATAMGQSQAQALEAAGTFGNLFKTMGIGGETAAKMSMDLTGLASDLASFNNIDPTEALDALRSGLVGEAEPMRRLGVLLSEDAVKQKAYQMGLAKTGEALTEQQKVQARYALILEQTKTAQGDFARTSDGMANKSRILKAQLTDVSATLGSAILPIVQKVAGFVSVLGEKFNGLSDSQKTMITTALLVVAAIGPVLMVFGKLMVVIGPISAALGVLIPMLGAFAAAFSVGGFSAVGGLMLAALGPIGLVIAGITAVVAVFTLLWTKCEWFRNFWIGLWNIIKDALSAFWEWAGPFIKGYVQAWILILKTAFTVILTAAKAVWNAIAAAIKWFWGWAGPFIKNYVQAWITILKVAFAVIQIAFKNLWNAVKAVVEWFWRWAGPFIKANIALVIIAFEKLRPLVETTRDIFNRVRDVAKTVWGEIVGVVKGAWNSIAGFINKIIKAFNWAIDKIPGVDAKPIALLPGIGDDSSGARPPMARQMGDAGGMGGWTSTLSSVVDAVNPLNILDDIPWPTAPAGIFAGAASGLLGLVKDAVIGLVKKAIASMFTTDAGGSAPLGPGYGWASILAKQFGLTVTSTFRPGSITAAGNVSDHSVYGRAADIAGSTGAMGNLWQFIKATAGNWKQAIYQHQMINYGRLGYYGPSDHFDHVHLARGGVGGDSRGLGLGTAVVINIGTVNASTPSQARAAGTEIGNAIIRRLATAKRNTARGTA